MAILKKIVWLGNLSLCISTTSAYIWLRIANLWDALCRHNALRFQLPLCSTWCQQIRQGLLAAHACVSWKRRSLIGLIFILRSRNRTANVRQLWAESSECSHVEEETKTIWGTENGTVESFQNLSPKTAVLPTCLILGIVRQRTKTSRLSEASSSRVSNYTMKNGKNCLQLTYRTVLVNNPAQCRHRVFCYHAIYLLHMPSPGCCHLTFRLVGLQTKFVEIRG